MIDFAYSERNLRKIFDIENRRGAFLESQFFPDVEIVSLKINRINQTIRRLKKRRWKGLSSLSTFQSRKNYLSEIKRASIKERDSLVTEHLVGLQNFINSKAFSIGIRPAGNFGGKATFSVDDNPSSFFASKQLHKELSSVFSVQQANRDHIVLQLKSLLSGGFPLFVLRTDIKDFYESIDHKRVLDSVRASPNISYVSRRLISQIFKEYKRIAGVTCGLPRGIACSSSLAEIYMNGLDEEIKNIEDVVYYARYVDDIVVVFAPNKSSTINRYRGSVIDVIRRHKLTENAEKTFSIDLTSSFSGCFEFLGYKFKFSSGSLSLSLSDKKIDKYKRRIDLIFSEYDKRRTLSSNKSRSLLIDRLREPLKNSHTLA